jgi:hypothetical protein
MTTVASAHTAPLTKREEIAEVDVETPLGEKKEAAEDNAKKWLSRLLLSLFLNGSSAASFPTVGATSDDAEWWAASD